MAQARIEGRSTPTQPSTRRVTLDEYLELLDTGGYEVIDGELIAMEPQVILRSNMRHALYHSLRPHIGQQQSGVVYMLTVFALEVQHNSGLLVNVMAPEVAFISSEQLRRQDDQYPDDDVYRVEPALAAEIVLFPNEASYMARKVERYLGYGVGLVWVIDPQNWKVHVHTPERPDGHVLGETATLDAEEILPGWSMPVKALFGEVSKG